MFSCWPHLMVRATAVCSCLLPLAPHCHLPPLGSLDSWLLLRFLLIIIIMMSRLSRSRSLNRSVGFRLRFSLRFDRRIVAKYKNKSQTHTHAHTQSTLRVMIVISCVCLCGPRLLIKQSPPQKQQHTNTNKTFLSSITSTLCCSQLWYYIHELYNKDYIYIIYTKLII